MNDVISWLAIGALCILYALLAHYASATPDIGAWMILPAISPVLILTAGITREYRWGLLIWPAIAAVVGWLYHAWPGLENPVAWLYLMQHVGANIVLGGMFGRSLLKERKPVCTMLAGMVHKEMTPTLLRYTRQVTLAWTIFFFVLAILSMLLFFLAPLEVWSVLANLLTLPLLGMMFVAENEVRKRVLPPEDRPGIIATVRAFRTGFRT